MKTFIAACLLTLQITASAQAATAHIGATVTFVRVEKIAVLGQNFTLAMDTAGAPVYQVQQTGNEKIIIVE